MDNNFETLVFRGFGEKLKKKKMTVNNYVKNNINSYPLVTEISKVSKHVAIELSVITTKCVRKHVAIRLPQLRVCVYFLDYKLS